jgi:hypothetical protein
MITGGGALVTLRRERVGGYHPHATMKTPTARPHWLTELRRLHDSHFGDDWDGHLRALNERLQLSGADKFGLPPGLPPSWFVGDVAALRPRRWALVVSLNQARREKGDGWHLSRRYTRQSYWDH